MPRAPLSSFSQGLALGLGALCAAVLAQAAWAASPLDDTIVVRGNHRIEAAMVRGYFHAADDGRIDPATVNAGLKGLYATGQFEDVKIDWSGSRLIVTVVEAPMIDRVQFEGNKQFKEKDLPARSVRKRRAVHQADVQDDASGSRTFTGTPAAMTRDHAQDRFQGRGTRRPRLRDQGGHEDRRREIVFAGNHAYSGQRLKGVIKTSESGWFAFLKTTDVYDPDHLEADRDLLYASISRTASPTPRWSRRPAPTSRRRRAS